MQCNKMCIDKYDAKRAKPLPKDDSYFIKRNQIRIKHVSKKNKVEGVVDLNYNDFKTYMTDFDKEIKN